MTRTRSSADRRRRWTILAAAALLAAFAPAAARADQGLAFAVAGVVEAVLVKPGAEVAKGAALARLDLRPLQAALRAAQAGVKAADVELEFARANAKRVEQLHEDLSTSTEELEQAKLTVARAQAGRDKAAAEAAIAGWRLERGTLTAPADGTVTQVPGYPGLVVDPGRDLTPVVMMK